MKGPFRLSGYSQILQYKVMGIYRLIYTLLQVFITLRKF